MVKHEQCCTVTTCLEPEFVAALSQPSEPLVSIGLPPISNTILLRELETKSGFGEEAAKHERISVSWLRQRPSFEGLRAKAWTSSPASTQELDVKNVGTRGVFCKGSAKKPNAEAWAHKLTFLGQATVRIHVPAITQSRYGRTSWSSVLQQQTGIVHYCVCIDK